MIHKRLVKELPTRKEISTEATQKGIPSDLMFKIYESFPHRTNEYVIEKKYCWNEINRVARESMIMGYKLKQS